MVAKYLPGKLIIWDTLSSFFLFSRSADTLVSEDTVNYEIEASFKLNL